MGSPFDYRSHAMLYVARHLPDRRRPESEAALHDGAGRPHRRRRWPDPGPVHQPPGHRGGGRNALEPRLPYRLLVQGQLPKGRLLEAFAAEETVVPVRHPRVLAGRRRARAGRCRWSPWTACPFARPDDPLLQARRDRAGDAAFRLVDLPRAATLLAQGAGRLIRSADDHGVVAVLDPRLATAGYRAVLLAGAAARCGGPPSSPQVEEFLRPADYGRRPGRR